MVSSKKPRITPEDFGMFEARAARGLEVARAIDEKRPIPHSVAVVSFRFTDFLNTLTPKRFELLQLTKKGKRSIAELAAAAGRDPSAVSKDIAKLVDLGLVTVDVEASAGHRAKKIVRPVAENIEISAAHP